MLCAVWFILFAACEAIPVDSGVYFSGQGPDSGVPRGDPGETFCQDLLPDGLRYAGTASLLFNTAEHCEGTAAMVWSDDDTITFYALCEGTETICLTADGSTAGGALTTALTMATLNGPTSGPHDATGTISDDSASLSWEAIVSDPNGNQLVFTGESTLSP